MYALHIAMLTKHTYIKSTDQSLLFAVDIRQDSV